MSDRRSRKPGEEEEVGPVGVVAIPAYWIMPCAALSTIKTIWYPLLGDRDIGALLLAETGAQKLLCHPERRQFVSLRMN